MLGKQRGSNNSMMSNKIRVNIPGSSGQVKYARQSSVGSPSAPSELSVVPQIKTCDSLKLLPKYHAALQRSQDESVQPDDLDTIQLELELLLSTVALRYRVLKAEYETIDKADDRRDKKNKYVDRQPSSPGKKKRPDEKQSKIKELKFSSNSNKLKKNNMSSIIPSPAPSQQTDDSMDEMSHLHGNAKDNKLLLPKNDAPSRFWLSVEPYCMPITQEDIKLIDGLIEEYSGPLIPPIPELGPHYSSKWATEDLKEEQDNSNPNVKPKSKVFTSQSSTEASGMVKKGEKLMGENVTGPVTQRLVCALIEDNYPHDHDRNLENGTGYENQNSSNRGMSLMKNGITIERRMRKELMEQGILDPEDLKPGQDDEILSEIKRVRVELSAIAEYNCNELRRLHTAAKDEIKRLEVKRKLDSVDQEIIETHKRIAAAKIKRRPLTKPERDEVFRLTEEQKRLSDLLDSMPMPGSSSGVGVL